MREVSQNGNWIRIRIKYGIFFATPKKHAKWRLKHRCHAHAFEAIAATLPSNGAGATSPMGQLIAAPAISENGPCCRWA